MKNVIAVLTLCAVFFSACKKNETVNTNIGTNQVVQAEELAVDSVKLHDSISISDSLSVTYSSKLLAFPSIDDKKLLDSIYFLNRGIKDFSKEGLLKYLQKDKDDYFASIRKDTRDIMADMQYSQSWNSDFYMDLKSTVNDFMHIQYLTNSYEGGAHGNYGFSERVFDLKNNKKLELKDITNLPNQKLSQILTTNINKINSGTTDSKGKVNNSDMLLVEMIPATDNFYFDDKNLYFHYSPYEIAAYAAGDIIIPISWEELKGSLVPEFKQRMKIK